MSVDDRGRSHRRTYQPSDYDSRHHRDASYHGHRYDHRDRMAVLKDEYHGKRSHSETRHNPRVGESNPRHSRSIAPPEGTHHHHGASKYVAMYSKEVEHATEKAISTAAAAIYHLRHEPGSWVGGKGAKVVSAAAAAALIDGFLDKGSGHTNNKALVSAIHKMVVESIVDGSSPEKDP